MASSFDALTDYIVTADYCTLFPDQLFGLDYRYCCYIHDTEYGNLVIRELSDGNLFNCVLNSANGITGIALFIASLMWLGVRSFGWIFYPKNKGK